MKNEGTEVTGAMFIVHLPSDYHTYCFCLVGGDQVPVQVFEHQHGAPRQGGPTLLPQGRVNTVCPRGLDPFHVVRYDENESKLLGHKVCYRKIVNFGDGCSGKKEFKNGG